MKSSSFSRSLIALSFLLLIPCGLNSARAEDAKGIAKILSASATTTFEGRKVSEDSVLETIGSLKTGSEGGAKFKLQQNSVVVEVAPNSEVKLVLSEAGTPHEVVELVNGIARLQVPPAKDAKRDGKKPIFTLRSKSVTMGVRGTDFLGVVTPVLDEAEIVVFHGSVDFTAVKNPKDTKLIEAGYWGGLGGRFGKTTQTPIKLSKEALAHFERAARGMPAYELRKAPETPTASTKDSSQGH